MAHNVWVVSRFSYCIIWRHMVKYLWQNRQEQGRLSLKTALLCSTPWLVLRGPQPTLYSPNLLLAPPLESPVGHSQFFRCCSAANFTPTPCGHDRLVILSTILELSPKVNAFGLGYCNSLGLPLVVELPL